MKCPVCLSSEGGAEFAPLAAHISSRAAEGEAEHSAWLSRYAGGAGTDHSSLTSSLERLYDTSGNLERWIVLRLIERIYGPEPHPFILHLQHPDRKTIYGYVMEHHHFLRQWVRCCAMIMAKTDLEEVQLYEIDNIISEFRGMPPDRPSHHELLLRMGESIGIGRDAVYAGKPLPSTSRCLDWWWRIASGCSWQEGMAAMHTLELTANPDIRDMGSKMTYFDASILDDASYSDGVKNFLLEGYRADAGHSMEALELIVKHCTDPAIRLDVQSVVYRTVALLDDYLNARLERGEMLEDKQH